MSFLQGIKLDRLTGGRVPSMSRGALQGSDG